MDYQTKLEYIAKLIDSHAWSPNHGTFGDLDWHPDDQKFQQQIALDKAAMIIDYLSINKVTEEMIRAADAAKYHCSEGINVSSLIDDDGIRLMLEAALKVKE